MKEYAKIVGFAFLGFVLIMHVFDYAYPGFIPTATYLIPFETIAFICFGYILWKGVEPNNPQKTGLPWKTWVIGLAVAGALMYKVYARTELPFGVYLTLFFLFLIISGALLFYERRYSRRR